MYKISTGAENADKAHARETATEALELIRELKKKNIAILEVKDRDGAILTIPQLEKLSDKENI
jgi:hypothetical protein